MAPERNIALWWSATLICWHQMKRTQQRKREDKSDGGSDWGKKGLLMRADGNVCARWWGLRGSEESYEKLGWDGKPEKRQNVRMHLCAGGDKKGSLGVQGLLLGLPNPQAQPSLQGMPQIWLSGSPCERPSFTSRFNMLCVPAPLTLPTSTIIVPERDPRSLLQGAY